MKRSPGAESNASTSVGHFFRRMFGTATVASKPEEVVGVEPQGDTPLLLLMGLVGGSYVALHGEFLWLNTAGTVAAVSTTHHLSRTRSARKAFPAPEKAEPSEASSPGFPAAKPMPRLAPSELHSHSSFDRSTSSPPLRRCRRAPHVHCVRFTDRSKRLPRPPLGVILARGPEA
jgi:hypothetical protein